MLKDWKLSFIFIIFIQKSQPDMVLNKFKSELGDWTKNMPKIWHNYIKMYLYRLYMWDKEQLPGDNVRNVLLQMVHTSRYLLLYGNKIRLTVNWFIFCPEYIFQPWVNQTEILMYHLNEIISQKLTERCIVKWEVGQFFVVTKNLVYLKSVKRIPGAAYWYLNRSLRLNLTFLSFYMSGGSLNKLSITQGGHRCQEETKEDFIFWGQHSLFYFYPKNRMVLMCITHRDEVSTEVQIIGMFMIFDRDQMFNIHLNQKKVEYIMKNLYWIGYGWEKHPHIFPNDKLKYIVNNKYELFRYSISVRKLDQVIIKNIISWSLGFLVFDGPGYLSHTISATKDVIVTSTFQCLVLFLMTVSKRKKIKHFKFSSKSLSTHNIITNVTNNNMFNIPNSKCRNKLCISLFLAESENEVNITAIAVKSTHPYDNNCLYAGLVAGERIANNYKESKTICESNYDYKGHAINFYSNNSSLILIMYSYKEYGEINASVMVSHTKCKPVTINLCYLNLLCFHDIIECQSYLNNVTKFSGINLKVQGKASVIHEENFRKCSILQVSSMSTELAKLKKYDKSKRGGYGRHFSIKSCSLTLTLKQIADISVKISRNRNDVIFIERMLDLCKNTDLCLKNISEPTIPRMTRKYIDWVSGYTSIIQYGSLKIKFKSLSTTSWIELVIHSNTKRLGDYLPFERFAMDFVLNAIGVKVPSLNLASGILMFKSNSKIFDSNISVTMDVIVSGGECCFYVYVI